MKGTNGPGETRFFPKNLVSDPASDARSRRDLTVWVTLFFLLVWALFTHAHVGSFNDRSRLAAIESRVARGTWIIDESPFSRTVDRIFVDGHFYSDKPPVLTFIASGVYTVLHRGFHLSLDASPCDFDQPPCHCRALCDDDPDWAYYLLTLTLVGLPSALMLALFYHLTGGLGLSNPAALLLTATLGLATQVFPYSTVLNSHVPAAACLLAGFYALLRAHKSDSQDDDGPLDRARGWIKAPSEWRHRKPPFRWRGIRGLAVSAWLFVAGLLTALAFTFDLASGLFFVAFFGYATWATLAKVRHQTSDRRHLPLPGTASLSRLRTTFARFARHLPWPYLLGGLLPIALMIFLDYQIVGNPLPPYMYTRGYDYPGSRFPQTIAGNRSPENVLLYGLRLIVGDRGLFAFNPVLLWAVVALVRVWRNCSSTDSKRCAGWPRAAAVIGLTSGLFALYFILFTDNFGGAAYGPRWYTVFIPLLFIFVAVDWRDRISKGSLGRAGFWVRGFLFLALAGISFANSYQGALNPWRAVPPLLRLEHAQPGWREPVDMALSGVTFEEIAPDLQAAFAIRRVDKRWFDARSCLVIPPGPTWFFVDPGTSLDPVLAERSGLATGGDMACYADLQPAWDVYLEQVATSAWASPALVPPDSDPSSKTPVLLPVGFGGQFTLLGYELLTEEPAAGAEVVLLTAWRVEAEPEPPLALFVHLLDPQGHIRGQFDGLGANPDGLRPGDLLLHVHRLAIAPDAPPGRYWLQMGLYNPETGARLPVAGHDADRLLLTQVDLTLPRSDRGRLEWVDFILPRSDGGRLRRMEDIRGQISPSPVPTGEGWGGG